MSKANKKAKLENVQKEIYSIERQLDQLQTDHEEIYEAEETLKIELSELIQKEEKILAKLQK